MCFWRKKPKREKCVECGYIFTPEDTGDKCPMCKTYRRCPFCQNKKNRADFSFQYDGD